jgi:CPA2 family monovalent cation:H+ antiporter-2
MHDLTIISVLAGALAVALAFGWLTRRLGLSPLVGYLLAGIAVGPHTPGFVADVRLAAQLAEIGVILLMFGVGLHLRLQDLLRVWRVAVPGALGQSACAAALGLGVALAFGWGAGAGLVLGMSLAVASTVMLMRMLSERDLLRTPDGHVAVGWLLVEDLLTVAALVVLPALASGEDSGLPAAVALAVAKAVGFALLVAALGPRVLSPLLEHMAGTRSAELFTLSVFVLALSIASLAAAAFHVSVPLGAFLGGLVVAQSRVGQQAATEMLPFRDVFSALFFVSVGMLFDPGFVLANPGITLAALGVILIAKPLAALAIVRLLGQPLATGLTVAIGLAQIGEFSFILAGLALALGVLPQSGFDLVVAGALVSTALNPLLFKALPVLSRRLNAPARRAHPQALAVPAAAEGSASGCWATASTSCWWMRTGASSRPHRPGGCARSTATRAVPSCCGWPAWAGRACWCSPGRGSRRGCGPVWRRGRSIRGSPSSAGRPRRRSVPGWRSSAWPRWWTSRRRSPPPCTTGWRRASARRRRGACHGLEFSAVPAEASPLSRGRPGICPGACAGPPAGCPHPQVVDRRGARHSRAGTGRSAPGSRNRPARLFPCKRNCL